MEQSRDQPLRVALYANTAFSACSAALLLIEPDLVAEDLGAPSVVLRAIGGSLAIFALYLVVAARAIRAPKAQTLPAVAAVGLDGLWVVGSLALLPFVAPSMSALGLTLFMGVAAAVGTLALLQYRGLDLMFARRDDRLGTTHHLEVDFVVDPKVAQLWPVVADLQGITKHAKGIAFASVEGEPGPGAIRTCENTGGKRWSEQVTKWAAGHGLELEFLSDQPGFPFPMHPMHGGWNLEDREEGGSRVSIWWSFSTKPKWLVPLIAPIMQRQARADMHAVVESMGGLAGAPGVADT